MSTDDDGGGATAAAIGVAVVAVVDLSELVEDRIVSIPFPPSCSFIQCISS